MKPRLVIAGAGSVGLAMATRSLLQWRPILIEIDPDRCAEASQTDGLEVFCGDFTSTLLLKRAQVQGASYAVATTTDDEANVEFCRLMREQFGAQHLVALAHSSESTIALQEMGVIAISRSSSVATVLESSLDGGRRTASNIGLGQGEICQVTVQSHSPVIGKTLAMLRPQSWILGAIYRDGRLVVPHGNTVIRSGDKCLLVGDPDVLLGISDYFQRGSSEFPLQFGTRYCLLDHLDAGLPDLQECQWLKANTEAKGVFVLHHGEPPAGLRDLFGDKVEARRIEAGAPINLTELTDEVDCAMLVTRAESLRWRDKIGVGNKTLFKTLGGTSEPVLVSRGSHPYKRILVAVSPSPGSLRASELAVDVARKLEVDLTAIAVEAPDFVVGAEYRPKLVAALDAVKAKAHLYSRRVKTLLVEGNPVTQVLKLADEFDLLIVAHRRERRFSLTKTDVSRHIIVGARCSVMVLPYASEDLDHGS